MISPKQIWAAIQQMIPAKKEWLQAQQIFLFIATILINLTDLKEKGVEFKTEIEDHGYGFITYFLVPGNFYVQLCQPKYINQYN